MKIDYSIKNPHNSRFENLGVIVMDNGDLIYPTQAAYLAGTNALPRYEAHAISADNCTDYKIVWNCVDGWMNFEDESDCCDWEKFTVIEL